MHLTEGPVKLDIELHKSDSAQLSILAIAGSLRRDSLNRRVLNAASAMAPAGMSIRVDADLNFVPLFSEDLETPTAPEAVLRLRAAVARASGVLIATPEYNQSMPGVVKNMVDWLSRGDQKVLDGKPVGILGATSGPWGTRLAQAALRQTLTACGALIMPAPQVYLRSAVEVFGEDGTLTDPKAVQSLTSFLSSFDRWVRRVQPEPETRQAVAFA